MLKPVKKTSLKMASMEEDQPITAAAESDPDALPLIDEPLTESVPIRMLRSRPLLANQ
jgi:hypothetical protein